MHDRSDIEGPSANINIVIMGDEKVGKTQLMNRFCEDKFSENYTTTIGVDFKSKTLSTEGSEKKLLVFDTAGKYRVQSRSICYRNAQAVILAFDLTNTESFDNLSKHLLKIKQDFTKNPDVILVGTKSDLESKITREQAEAFVIQHGLREYYTTSAKSGAGVDGMFKAAALEREVPTVEPVTAGSARPLTSDFSFNPFKGVSGDLSIPAYAYHITKSEWSSESDNITLQRAGLVDWCTLFLPALILMLLKRTYNVLSQMADNVYKGTLAAAATIFLDVSHWLFPVCLVVLVVGLALSALLKLGSLAVGIGMVPVMLVHSVAALALTAVSLPFVALERSIRACFSSGAPDVSHGGGSTTYSREFRGVLPTQGSESNREDNKKFEKNKQFDGYFHDTVIKREIPPSARNIGLPPTGPRSPDK